MITKQEYQAQAAAGYNRIPLVQELLADLDTPLSLYLKLANRPYTYLLESVVGGERFGRYSFIGLPCRTYLKASGKHVDVYCNGEITEQFDGNPLTFIEAFHQRFKTPEIPNLPRFTGGLVGYFGYETIYNFEHFAHRFQNSGKPDTIGTPDILLMLSQELAVVDNLSGKIYLIATKPRANGWKTCAPACAKAAPSRSRSAAEKPNRSTKPAKRAIKNTCAKSANIFSTATACRWCPASA